MSKKSVKETGKEAVKLEKGIFQHKESRKEQRQQEYQRKYNIPQ